MDQSRVHDLSKLTMVVNDPGESALHKRQAARAIAKIKETLKDKKLLKERERLIRATQAGDVNEVEKIGEIIREHMLRTYGRV